jgi:hypothetical protein
MTTEAAKLLTNATPEQQDNAILNSLGVLAKNGRGGEAEEAAAVLATLIMLRAPSSILVFRSGVWDVRLLTKSDLPAFARDVHEGWLDRDGSS